VATLKRTAKKGEASQAPQKPMRARTGAQTRKKTDFYVVGIGGSAGSLEALEQFFSRMPVDTVMAFVIVQRLLNSTEVATIFLDNDLNVIRFTATASKFTNLVPADVGRPIDHIVSKLKYSRFREDVKEVLATLVFKEIQLETTDKTWYLMRIIPCRTSGNVIEGVVITFTNITGPKILATLLAAAEQRCLELESKIDAAR
jgi:hypothetical protein